MLSSRMVAILCLFFTFANMMPAPGHFLVETEDDGRLMLVCKGHGTYSSQYMILTMICPQLSTRIQTWKTKRINASVGTADRGHTMDKHLNAWVEIACGRALQVCVFIFNTFCFRISLNYFIVDNGNDFLCKGGNCDDQLTDVSSAFSSPFFSG